MGKHLRAASWIAGFGALSLFFAAEADTTPARPGLFFAQADTVPAADTIPRPDTVPTPADTITADPDAVPTRAAEDELDAADTIPAAADTAAAPPDTTTAAERIARRADAARSDSIFQALSQRQGYAIMEYGGDSATFHAQNRVLRLFGPAEVKRGADELTARDTIVYREDSQFVYAYGKPKLAGEGQQPIEGNVMFYDLNTQRATVLGGRTQIAEAGANWYVQGDVTAEGNERIYAVKSIFTTDDREEPAYYFEADNIKVIRDRVLVGRPARLYFRNVPVFWLPFVFQDLTRGRRSGLLAPEFSMNDIVRTSSSGETASGTGRRIDNVGFYWAMSDYADAQLSGGWQSGVYRQLTGSLRYRVTSQFLDGGLSYRRYWQETGNQNMHLAGQTSWRPDERTNLAANVNYSTSTQFLRNIATDPELGTQTMSSSAQLGRRFDWGQLDLGGSRNQSLGDGKVDRTFPRGSLMIRPITFFQEPNPAEQRWYSNTSFSLNLRGDQQVTSYTEARPGRREDATTNVSLSPSLQIGNFEFGPGITFRRFEQPERPEEVWPMRRNGESVDSVFPFLPRVLEERATWNTGFGYGIPLMGETRLTPGFNVSQDIRRDSLTGGELVAGPLRPNYTATLNTTLYGFFPGFGQFGAIRHKITPGFSYRYSPAVTPREGQEAFISESRRQNVISLGSINQTFETKVRAQPRQNGAAPADTLAEPGDTVNGGAAALSPPEERTVTLLSISTTGFEYDFEAAAQGESGLRTRTVSNSITSEYLRGLQLNFSHELFDPADAEPGTLGRFSPILQSMTTNFSLDANTPIIRRLFGGPSDEQRGDTEARDTVPEETAHDPQLGHLPGTRMSGVRPAQRGPWRMDVGYNYRNSRTADPLHDFALRTSFSPTDHWSVSWATSYGVGEGFGTHRLTLTRDLYRWEANFNFTRTITGNTSFDVLVRLKDLPDIKVDYRDYNIGGQRQQPPPLQ